MRAVVYLHRILFPRSLAVPSIAAAFIVGIAGIVSVVTAKSDEPLTVTTFDQMPKIVQLPDGRLMALFQRLTGEMQDVTARYSKDNGYSWSAPDTLLKLPQEAGGWGYFIAFVDREGEVHVFVLNDANTGTIRSEVPERMRHSEAYLSRLDIWHIKSINGRKGWQTPKMIWKGRAGDLQSVIQLSTGRIILPISYMTSRSWSNRGEGFYAFTYAGKFETSVLYSDDAGDTWQSSSSVLKVPTPDITTIEGAVEPVVLELKDGRVWMLIRTQMGRFHESFSADGAEWSRPQPMDLLSSDSPAGLIRLKDGRILLIWNNCLRFPYAYGGRQVLHAAVSEDEGRTWHGYREVARDPYRKQPPPPSGDHGVSYPFPVLTRDGKVVFSMWVETGVRRSVVEIDPKWLDETTQSDDFSSGLDKWSTFGTRGVELVPHPQKTGVRLLSLTKPEASWPAGAVWNFPYGRTGRLRLRLMLKPGFKSLNIGLTDHFSAPFDEEDRFHNLFNVSIDEEGRLAKTVKLEASRWYELELRWNTARRECRIVVAGRQVAVVPQNRAGEGAGYLRLRSMASSKDQAGILIELTEAWTAW
jgi:hypothetical protein